MAARPYHSSEPSIRDHQEWLGYVQPNGLVVSSQVLFDQQVIIDRATLADLQRDFINALAVLPGDEVKPQFGRFLGLTSDGTPHGFATNFLGWHADQIDWNTLERNTLLPCASVHIPELDATLTPTAALRFAKVTDPTRPYQLLAEELAPNTDLDEKYQASHLWETTPSTRFERMLTETGVSLGVLSNGHQLRLFYAPRGETAGHITFDVQHMTGTAGRLIVGGLHALLSAFRLTNAPTKALLTGLCETSRKYQSTVSAALAEQVLEALYEFVRGFQSANDQTHGELLRAHLAGDDDDKQHIYRGLLRTLMRSVFLLFAEDRDLLPAGDLYYRNYSLHGLFERLRKDDGRHRDTMDSRYGAWAQLLALFRLIHQGSAHPLLSLPARHGYLFDPDAFPFLEGRTLSSAKPPLVSDGCVYRVLEKLLLLKGEKLSYRTLDVEQIGSVYETMMGFRMTVAEGASIAIKAKKKGGAPIGLDLEAVLAATGDARAKYIEDKAEVTLTPKQKPALKSASDINSLVAAIESKVAHAATPRIVPKGAMLLQPSDERRRSGSHYTPRSLTQPIVAKTLEPILARLGPDARPDQILDLKICDPAMGSGAFLVEVCRQLGKRLEDAWTRTGTAPRVTAQDDLLTLSRRLVAQRCVYGVDRNDMAVDLAKLSLWLATLAKDHPFTFLDHALRHGDSLVGLDLAQLDAFHWDASRHKSFVSVKINERLHDAIKIREEIRRADDSVFREEQLKTLLAQSEAATAALKMAGDLVIAAFFSEEKDNARLDRLAECAVLAQAALGTADVPAMERAKRHAAATIAKHELVPFQWAITFPEVFMRATPGFDALVGNPPFLGVTELGENAGSRYTEFLRVTTRGAAGKTDLVAFFVRRAATLTRRGGAIGFITTKTIYQGDTRRTGLGWLLGSGQLSIYAAQRRFPWQGAASVICCWLVLSSHEHGEVMLDGKKVSRVSSFLLASSHEGDPKPLIQRHATAYLGVKLGALGFVEDPHGVKGPAPCAFDTAMHGELPTHCIRSYLGGSELNSMPRPGFPRRVLDLSTHPAPATTVAHSPLAAKVRTLVCKQHGLDPELDCWWRFAHYAHDLQRAARSSENLLALARSSDTFGFVELEAAGLVNDKIIAFLPATQGLLCLLQSRVHEIWARTFSSTIKDDLQYTPSDCFSTFPFPESFGQSELLKLAGSEYAIFRAALMVKYNEGITKTYNRFHDPENHETDIVNLRDRHAAMDRAVLDAYGWHDIKTDCDFFPDYTEEDEDGNEVEKSIRYRWPDEVRDEVLARLLALNAERHAEEVKLGLVSSDGKRLKRAGNDDDDGEDGDDADVVKTAKTKPAARSASSKAKKQRINLSDQLDFGGND